jgi:hypothetical protein
VAKVFAANGQKVSLLFAIHGVFLGLNVPSGASFDFDEAKYVLVPGDQIDFTATIGRSKIARDHYISNLSEIEVGGFFTAPTGSQMIWNDLRRQSFCGDPVEGSNDGVGKASRRHNARVWRGFRL